MRDGVRRVACKRWGVEGSCTRDDAWGRAHTPLPAGAMREREATQRKRVPFASPHPLANGSATGGGGCRNGVCTHPPSSSCAPCAPSPSPPLRATKGQVACKPGGVGGVSRRVRRPCRNRGGGVAIGRGEHVIRRMHARPFLCPPVMYKRGAHDWEGARTGGVHARPLHPGCANPHSACPALCASWGHRRDSATHPRPPACPPLRGLRHPPPRVCTCVSLSAQAAPTSGCRRGRCPPRLHPLPAQSGMHGSCCPPPLDLELKSP